MASRALSHASVVSPLGPLISVIREMIRKISEWRLVGTMKTDLLQRIHEIEVQLIEMDKDEDIAANLKVMEVIKKAQESLQECHETCTEIANQSLPIQVLYSGSNKTTVENLHKRLGEIHQDLMSAVTIATYQKVSHIKRSMGSQVGAYPITDNVSPPTAVDKPECSIKNDKQIEVKWNKSSSSVENYEIKVNGKKISNIPSNHCIIDSPIFNRKPGIYTLQVRAINAGGVGEWSDEAILAYKIGPPNQPQKPKITPDRDNVKVYFVIPGIDESNGVAVNKVIIRYNLKSTPDDWHNKTLTVNETLPYTLGICMPYTYCSFRIILVNDCGESIPSEIVPVHTSIKLPGKPANFRVLRFLNSHVYIAWNQPADNALFVVHYALHFCVRNGCYQPFCITEDLSVVVTNLRPGVEYIFKIFAVNKNGNHSDAASLPVKTKPELRLADLLRFLCITPPSLPSSDDEEPL